MNNVTSLLKQKSHLLKRIELCFEPQKYVPLKNKLRLVERKLAIESGEYQSYSLIVLINQRIDELATKRAKAILEKQTCNNLERYRKLVDTIRLTEDLIAQNENMIKKAGG